MSNVAENLEGTAEAPERIWAESVEGKWRNGAWSSKPAPDKFPDEREFMLASAHDAELKAAMDTHAAITAKLGEVAKQRDQCLAALKGCDAAYSDICKTGASGYIEDEEDAAFKAARAAISACEGGQDAEG